MCVYLLGPSTVSYSVLRNSVMVRMCPARSASSTNSVKLNHNEITGKK